MPRCCNNDVEILDIIPLEPLDIYADRKILIGLCPRCNKTKYFLQEFDTIKNQLVINRNVPKRIKNVDEYIKKLMIFKTDAPITEIKKGTKSGMAFIYGKTIKRDNKTIHLGYDFNGTERYKEVLN